MKPDSSVTADGGTDIVRSMVKKMEETSLSVPTVLPPGMDSSGELEWLRIQNKDLSEKLESLRIKRKEDHAKMMEFERNRIQLEALLEYKAKMTDAHTALQRKLQEKEKELKDTLEARQDYQADMSDIEEQLELVTLDKEMAEEKVEMLQAEIDAQKERIEELEMELEILKTEMEQAGGNAVEGNSIQMKQMEQQNEKLREALVKMRDITNQSLLDKQEMSRETENLKEELAELVKLCEKLKKDAENTEQMNVELKEQVDAAMGSEQMIEKLTEKNLDMEEKIRALEESIEDFDAMRAMDEEILETQKEAEKELRQELDLAYGKISELQMQIKACGVQAEDTERTILKFRKKVVDLNEEIQEHKDQILRLEEQAKRVDDNINGLQASNIFKEARTFAEIIESDTRAIELEFSHLLIKYLKAFLPDNFTKPGGDNDAIIINILYPRLSKKVSLLSRLINEKFPSVPGGMRREHVTKSHKAEQWAHAAKFTYLLKVIEGISEKFCSALQLCSVERLSRLAQMQIDMASQEKFIDQYIESLRANRIDENTSTESLEKLITYFQNIFSVYMAGEAFDVCGFLNNTIAQLLKGLNWLNINTERIKFFLIPSSDENEIAQFVASLFAAIAECEQLSVRCRNRIPNSANFSLTSEVEEELVSAIKNLEQSARIMDDVCSIASTQLSMLTDVEGLEVSRLKEMLQGAVEKVHGQTNGSKAQDCVNVKIFRNYLHALKNTLTHFVSVLDRETMEVEKLEKKSYPPLLERAHARKHDAVEADGLRWQIEKKDNEIVELKKTLRARADDISNYRLRLEMADKKMESSGKADESRVQNLQTRCEELQSELKKTRTEFDETMDALQRDLEATEKENADLREKTRNMTKKALLMAIDSTAPTPTNVAGNFSSNAAEITYLESELAEKQKALKWADIRIRQLKSCETLRILSETNSLEISSDICGPLTLSAVQSSEKEELDKLIREVEILNADCRAFQVPFIVDLNKPKKRREIEERQYYSQIKSINRRIGDVKFRIQRFWVKYHPKENIPTLIGDLPYISNIRRVKIFINNEGKGIHSEEYKIAFDKLFGSLKAEREIFEKNLRFHAVAIH
ncbi:unnamed protein product [Dracunculus medinensis]|uniref:Dynein associated protein domain-containing protein n=1 Tax=Dracunculus medinensis TaxID=318479 RepID=A0A3P7Q7H7_DRAME|nr:unnamed protein product [Dracunculus medinensis]